ncbi:rRNA maturation RNase YbeY [Patescibacteria group bacterium]|nr:rRNA maturation RNase YbeY [Patescibacteria group bacterium]
MSLQIKNFTKNRIEKKFLDKVAQETLKTLKLKKTVEISLVISGEKRIRTLNKKYRKIDKVTDVLSFGNEDTDNSVKFVFPSNNVISFGEIFICYPKIQKQAREKKHSTKKEFSILLIHGILHLAGFDHLESYENSVMKEIEIDVLKKL